MNKLESFLNELTQLSEKYKLFIGGCGCCGSPYLTEKPLYDSFGEAIDNPNGNYVISGAMDDLRWRNKE